MRMRMYIENVTLIFVKKKHKAHDVNASEKQYFHFIMSLLYAVASVMFVDM